MENKQFFQIEFKDVEVKEGSIRIKGYASTPDIDRYDDIVSSKAFKSSIEQYMKNPIILLQHDSDKPIGKTLEYTIKGKGLEIVVEITNNIENVMQLITDKVLGAFSIGFIPKKWIFEEKEGRQIRIIEDLDLLEVSVVSTPANSNALFTLSKSIKSFFDALDKEDILITNNNSMETKEIVEEVKDEEVIVSDDVKTAVEDEVKEEEVKDTPVEEEVSPAVDVDVLDNGEVSDESSDNSDVKKEDEKSLEVMEEKASDNGIELLKAEILEIKASMETMLEVLASTVNATTEIKSIVDKIPAKRGLATIDNTEKKSALFKRLEEARNNIL